MPRDAWHLIVLAIRLDSPSVEIYGPDALNASLASNRFPDSESARPKSVCVGATLNFLAAPSVVYLEAAWAAQKKGV